MFYHVSAGVCIDQGQFVLKHTTKGEKIFFHSLTVVVTVLDSFSYSVCHCPISARPCSMRYHGTGFGAILVRLKILPLTLM